MRYLLDQPELVADFVARMIPQVGARGFGRCTAIGMVDDDGELVAGLVYHNLSPEAGLIEISGAALPETRWLTRETIRIMHGYPFLQCGCQMAIMKVLKTDLRLQRQLAALNYMFIDIPRLFGRGEDGVLCLLTQEDWMASKFYRRLHRIDALKEAA